MVLSELERKISVRSSREDLVKRGVLKEVDVYPIITETETGETGDDDRVALTSTDIEASIPADLGECCLSKCLFYFLLL